MLFRSSPRYNISHLSRVRVLYLGSAAQNGGGENSARREFQKGERERKTETKTETEKKKYGHTFSFS